MCVRVLPCQLALAVALQHGRMWLDAEVVHAPSQQRLHAFEPGFCGGSDLTGSACYCRSWLLQV